MTAPQLNAQVSEIQQLCGYLRDDKAIANYFGISVERVAKVRSSLPKSDEQRYWLHRREARWEGHTPESVNRDPCPYCETRRDIGCRHFLSTGRSTENIADPLVVNSQRWA